MYQWLTCRASCPRMRSRQICRRFVPQDFGGAGDGAGKRRRWGGGKEGGRRIRGRESGGVEGAVREREKSCSCVIDFSCFFFVSVSGTGTGWLPPPNCGSLFIVRVDRKPKRALFDQRGRQVGRPFVFGRPINRTEICFVCRLIDLCTGGWRSRGAEENRNTSNVCVEKPCVCSLCANLCTCILVCVFHRRFFCKGM